MRTHRTLLAALAAVISLTACQADAPDAPAAPDAAATPPGAAPAASQADAPDAGTIAGKLPPGDKPVLRQLNIYSAKDYNTYPTAAVIEAGTGYHVEYDMLPSDGAADKLNLIMATQEYYDIIVTGGDSSTVMNYAREGALTDLNPWLPLAPRLNAAINDYERGAFTLDGGLYAIGMQSTQVDGRGPVNSTVFFRQDYLDALGLAVPETTESFAAALKALKGYDNGTGTPTVPLTLSASSASAAVLDGIGGAFGIPNEWNVVDGALVNRAADPRTKDYLAYMKDLYQRGLIDADYPANQSANVNEKFSTGVAGSAYLSCYDYQNFGDSMKTLQPAASIRYMAPLQGPAGRAVGSTVGGMDRIAFVPAVCKNIEHVVNFMDLKLEPALFEDITIGQEGTHYTVDEKGERWPILPAFTDERASSVNYYAGRPADTYAEYWKLRVKKRADIWDCWSFLNTDPAVTAHYVPSEVGYAPAMDSTQYAASLQELFLEQVVKTIAGETPVEDFDRFTGEWLAAGGQQITDDYNAWWAGYKAS